MRLKFKENSSFYDCPTKKKPAVSVEWKLSLQNSIKVETQYFQKVFLFSKLFFADSPLSKNGLRFMHGISLFSNKCPYMQCNLHDLKVKLIVDINIFGSLTIYMLYHSNVCTAIIFAIEHMTNHCVSFLVIFQQQFLRRIVMYY